MSLQLSVAKLVRNLDEFKLRGERCVNNLLRHAGALWERDGGTKSGLHPTMSQTK